MKRPPQTPASVAVRRILLVDDHPITRQGLTAMIGLEPDLEVCGEAETAAAALTAIEAHRPDLVLVDLSLPGRSGLDLIKDLAASHPGLPTLVLSMHEEGLYAERAIRAGARGYLMKSAGGKAVMEAVRHVLAGQIYVSPAVSARILESLSPRHATPSSPPGSPARPAQPSIAGLSDREFEVFQLIGQGLGTREIAGRLNLSIKTIEAHRAHLKEKLGIKDAPGLVREAVRWIENQQRP
jgi:DNA-binding NarL/FixJ family response regulator